METGRGEPILPAHQTGQPTSSPPIRHFRPVFRPWGRGRASDRAWTDRSGIPPERDGTNARTDRRPCRAIRGDQSLSWRRALASSASALARSSRSSASTFVAPGIRGLFQR